MSQFFLENLYPFCQVLLECDLLVPRIHYPWCYALDHPAHLSQQLTASRGTFKTTILNANALRRCIQTPGYKLLKKSMTQPLAEDKVLEILNWCEQKPLLRQFFGWAFPGAKRNVRWGKRALQFSNGSMILAAGIGTRVQGMHFDQIDRDDTVGPRKDNATGEELCPTPEDVIKDIRDYQADFYLSKHYGRARSVVANTRWAPNDLIQYQRERERKFTQFIEFCVEDAEGNPTWPEQWPADAIARSKERNPFLHAGQVQLNPRPLSKLTWKPGTVRTYSGSPARVLKRCEKRIMILDPCGESAAKRTSDWALVTTGVNNETNKRYVLDCQTGASMNYKVVGEAIFSTAAILEPTVVGIETNIQETFFQWLEDEMRKRGILLPLHSFKSGNDAAKADRIRTLALLSVYDMLYFHESQRKLIEQANTHPFCGKMDALDACSLHLRYAPRSGFAKAGEDKDQGLWRYIETDGRRHLAMDWDHYRQKKIPGRLAERSA